MTAKSSAAKTASRKVAGSAHGGAKSPQKLAHSAQMTAVEAPGEVAALAAGERACPTRVDGASPLFQHRLTANQCQSKQRGMYHKCFSCAHSNARR